MKTRQEIGASNRARGKALENSLAFLHQHYFAHDLACIRHNGTIANLQGGEWVPLKSLPDYSGLIASLEGRYVSFDVKLISGSAYNHPKNKLHQCEHLWDVKRFGGIAFILVVIDSPGDDWNAGRGWALWPQTWWQSYYGSGWSVNLETATPEFATEVPRWEDVSGGYLPDWLSLFWRPAPG